MANQFKKVTLAVTDTSGTLYTVPAATTTIVIGFMISNLGDVPIEVDVEVGGIVYGHKLPIPVGASISALDGKLVLETTETVDVTSNVANSANAFLSIMEITA